MKSNLSGMLMCSVFLLINCSSEENLELKYSRELANEKSLISAMTQQEKFDFVLKHLGVLRDGLLTISTDESFQKFIHSEVENQFNDDYQVLLKNAFNKKAELFKQASNSIYIKDASLKNSLNAFTNIIDGKEQIDLYPQLFIPNYETINKLSQNPTIVCFSGDDNIEKAMGIKIDSEGVPIEVMVDEEYTLNNEVWVLSLSEGDVFKNPLVESVENSLDNPRSESSLNRINQSIQFKPNCFGLSEEACPDLDPNWDRVQIYKYNIKCLKESIFSGNADVYVSTWTAFRDFINPSTNAHEDVDWFGDPDWRSIIKIEKKELNRCLVSHFTMIYDWVPSTEYNPSRGLGDIVLYVIFEYDSWPAPLKTQYVALNGSPSTYLNIAYRSSQSLYGSGVFTSEEKCLICGVGHGTTACDHWWSNDCAEFTFRRIPG